MQAMVTERLNDIEISEMKINSHIIQLDNMPTVAILTLGEMVERVMIDRTASTCVKPDMVYEGLMMELLQGPCSIAVTL